VCGKIAKQQNMDAVSKKPGCQKKRKKGKKGKEKEEKEEKYIYIPLISHFFKK